MLRSKFWKLHPGGYAEGKWGGEGLVLLVHGPDKKWLGYGIA